MHILVVEDDRFFQKFYSHKLEEEGFRVDTADNGEIGLKIAREGKPDIILLDLVMPIKDGFDFLAAREKDEVLKKIPVLVFSTLGQEQDIDKAKSLGATGYVNKSFFDFDNLKHKLLAVAKE